MLPILRGVSGRLLRRSLSTAATRPPWVMMDRETQLTNSPVAVSSSFAPPPSASCIIIPVWSFDLEPPGDNAKYVDTIRSRLLAASAHGFLLLDTLKARNKAHPLADLDLPVEVLLKVAPFELVYRRLERRVCNPVTGELFRLPDFHGAEKTSTDGMGLLTHQADGSDGPPSRYVAAQLTEVDGGRRFMLRRFSSERGDWSELVLPSPLPHGRRLHMNHEVLDFGGRLWWVDVSWRAVCIDPFSDRPELRAVELPAGSMLPCQQGEAETSRLVKHRHVGVSAGRLCYAEVDPFYIRYFTLDDESGRCWTLEHQVSVANLWPNVKVVPLIAAIDPLNTDVLHLKVDQFNVSVDMCRKRMIESSHSPLTSYLPCLLPSFLGSSPIAGKNSNGKNKTLADVLVRSDRHPKT